MSNNTRIWDKLCRTDPDQTKSFKRAGGFSGTAIKPMWSFKRMTEEFGPCGMGWGVNEPKFDVVNGCDGEVLVYCTVSIWWNDVDKPDDYINHTVFGVGGDKVVVKQSSGLRSDDEAFKKAYTDAIGNALKLIGVGADVHMGLFDDSKYVQELKDEARGKAAEPVHRPSTFPSHLSAITAAKTLDELKTVFGAAKADKTLTGTEAEDLIIAKDARKAQLTTPDVSPNFDNLQP